MTWIKMLLHVCALIIRPDKEQYKNAQAA